MDFLHSVVLAVRMVRENYISITRWCSNKYDYTQLPWLNLAVDPWTLGPVAWGPNLTPGPTDDHMTI